MRSDTASMSTTSRTTMGIMNQPMLNPWVAASNAVAPAGGWEVFVRIMRAVVMAQAKGPLSSGSAAACGFIANSLAIPMPIAEANV